VTPGGAIIAAVETQFASNPEARGGESLRIVVGENNADLAMTLTMLIDDEPDMHCVGTASSTRAVLGALEEHSPNAFILDLSLDDGSSLPLLGILRQRLPAAVIVVFTGHKNDLLNEQCVRAGANSVVVKSGDFEELTSALRNGLAQGWRGATP
jgi:DNA-binding NarL/FixJ family response regulator